jgi:hypothetical protein
MSDDEETRDDVFTAYVRQLAEDGESLNIDDYNEITEHLRALLVTEMRRRGLWTAPPSYLGLIASSSTSWYGHDRSALEELTHDAYTYIFVERLRSLANQLKTKPNIRGLVVRNVRHFLTDRQRKADPIGYRIFARLKQAVERLLELGRLFLLGLGLQPKAAQKKKAKIHNASLLSFLEKLPTLATPGDLAEPVARWNDHLLPELITAEGRAVPAVVERLSEAVGTLPEAGIQAFRMDQLAKALKDDSRRRLAAFDEAHEETVPEDAEPGAPRVPVAHPQPPPGRWPGLRAAVLACVEHTIDAVRQAKRQRDLWRVWIYLRDIRLESDASQPFPADAALGRTLEMPRERIRQMIHQLRDFTHQCLETTEDFPHETATPEATGTRDARPPRT